MIDNFHVDYIHLFDTVLQCLINPLKYDATSKNLTFLKISCNNHYLFIYNMYLSYNIFNRRKNQYFTLHEKNRFKKDRTINLFVYHSVKNNEMNNTRFHRSLHCNKQII